MNYHVLTLFPEMILEGMNTSIIGRAMAKGLLTLEAVNIRDYSVTGNGRIDDYPYGGGAGMVMQAEPVYRAYLSLTEKIGYVPRVVYLTPQGKVFNQEIAGELAQEKDLVFLCGHYEGIDVTGGELPARVVMDAVSRMVPGVLSNQESGQYESFQDGLLEYPQYSRPEEWRGRKVPPVLLSGHHGNVEKWRREQSIIRTYERRPDLLEKCELTEKEKKWFREWLEENM